MALIFFFLTSCLSALPEQWEPTTSTTWSTTTLSTTTWTANSNKLTMKEKCERNPVQLHVGKRGKLTREGTDSVIIRVKQPIPSDSNYTALAIFNRDVCGIDLLRKMYTGDVK